MTNKLGVLLMEGEGGDVSVQLYLSPEKLKESFDELSGKPGDSKKRATMLTLDYDANVLSGEIKSLPFVEDKSGEPDMYVLGFGPAMFKDGWQEEVREAFKEFRQ